MTSLLAFILVSQSIGPAVFQEIDAARQKGFGAVRSLFVQPSDAAMVATMARDEGDLKSWKMHVVPALNGWGKPGELWLALSTNQELQLNHNLLFRLVKDDSGWKIGPEVTELEPQGARLVHDSLGVDFREMASNKIRVTSFQQLKDEPGTRESYWKINPEYRLVETKVGWDRTPLKSAIAPEGFVSAPPKGYAVQVGGFLFVGENETEEWLHFTFEANFKKSAGDRLDRAAGYLTSYWFPHLSRMPRATRTTILVPKGIEALSEGELVSTKKGTSHDEWTYTCPLPVTWSKAVVGDYEEVATKTVDGVQLRSWQIKPVDKRRAQADIDMMSRALREFSKYGKFPFKSYTCADANGYYGIESYSFTLIEAEETTRVVSHELGHTWFGGKAPCRYAEDSWCESVTQYVDSIRFLNDADGTLGGGFGTMRSAVPLDAMANAWSHNSATYTRGAYVLNMLESVIGESAMTLALRRIAGTSDPQLDWHRLRPYFERASNLDLKWFWDQWVSAATWPRLAVASVKGDEVTVTQSGTTKPYRLRFRIMGGNAPIEVEMREAQQSFVIPGIDGKKPTIEVFPFTLAKA